MERANHFNELLKRALLPERMDLAMPDESLMEEARERISLRRKKNYEVPGFLLALVHLLKAEFKFYHLGMSVLLITGSMLYLGGGNYGNGGGVGLTGSGGIALSITDHTISINSGTILASIPTTIIRN